MHTLSIVNAVGETVILSELAIHSIRQNRHTHSNSFKLLALHVVTAASSAMPTIAECILMLKIRLHAQYLQCSTGPELNDFKVAHRRTGFRGLVGPPAEYQRATGLANMLSNLSATSDFLGLAHVSRLYGTRAAF